MTKPMKILETLLLETLLLILLLMQSVQAAQTPGAVRINTDTTGTNTKSSAVTITLQTNLNAGVVNATNSVRIGSGSTSPGALDLYSTNGTFLLTQTVASDGTFQLNFGTTNLLEISIPSGYTGTGALFLSDDGTYQAVSSAPSISVSNFYATNIYSETIYVSNLFATNIYVTNAYITNLTVQTITNVSNFYATNAYISNLYVTNITAKNLTVQSNFYVSFSGFITNDLTVYGNTYSSNLYAHNAYITNQLQVLGSLYASNFFFTNMQGTIDPTATGLTLKQRRSLKLQYPRRIDGAGCTYSNTNDYTAQLFMVPRFSAAGATNANFAEFAFRVPSDIDTSVDLTASLSVQLAGADTSAATYTVGVVSIANSSAGAGTPANYVTLTIAADGSGASGDVESVNAVTLTGWAAALTANQWALVRLQRDGADASAVAQDGLELELFYTSTQ
jgi:hypothetical protein